MLEEKTLLIMIVGMAVVTYLPRVLPLHISSKHWPNWLKNCIEYLAVALIAAITIPTLFVKEQDINFYNPEFIAFIPTIIVAYFTRNLIATVVTGVISFIGVSIFLFG